MCQGKRKADESAVELSPASVLLLHTARDGTSLSKDFPFSASPSDWPLTQSLYYFIPP